MDSEDWLGGKVKKKRGVDASGGEFVNAALVPNGAALACAVEVPIRGPKQVVKAAVEVSPEPQLSKSVTPPPVVPL